MMRPLLERAMNPGMSRFFLSLALWASLPATATADTLPLEEISRYLNGLKTAEAGFIQINEDGSTYSGRLFIHRPGRIRFEYDPPNDALVMAGGGQVAIFDPKSNQPPEQYPIRLTPLAIILDENIDLEAAGMILDHRAEGKRTILVAHDPANPDYGSIELAFAGPPAELQEWTVVGGDGSRTIILLEDVRSGIELSSFLFNIPHEIRQREDGNGAASR